MCYICHDISVFSVTSADIDSLPFTVLTAQIMYDDSNWNDVNHNLLITGVESYQECYKRCLITNGDYCYVFRCPGSYLCLLPVSVTCVCYLCLLPVSATLNELQTHCQCTQKNVQVSIVNLNSYLTSAVRKIGVLHFPIMRWCCIGFRPHLLCFCST